MKNRKRTVRNSYRSRSPQGPRKLSMIVDAVKLEGNRKRAFGMATKIWNVDGPKEYHVIDVTDRVPEVKKGDTIILDAS